VVDIRRFAFYRCLASCISYETSSGSKDAFELDALKKAATGFTPVRASPVDLIADGVIHGTPFHHEPDGTVVAMVDGRTIRFKSIADLELMLEAKGATQLGASP
jgi:hypothetical protein